MDRFYVSVLPFAIDICNVLRERVGFLYDGAKVAKLTPEQKHIKQRANIIISKIKPMLLAAARSEADLGLRGEAGAEENAQRVLLVLQSCLKGDTGLAASDEQEDENATSLTNGNDEHDGDGDLEMGEATGRESDGPNNIGGLTAHEEIVNGKAIKFRLDNGETTTNGDDADESVPALSNSGSTNLSNSHAEPATPPRSDKDHLAPLTHGGIAWYLEAFKPHGTTIHDEEWSGRTVLRELSEELSDMDEDTLNGMDVELQDRLKSDTLKPIPAPKRKAPSRKKRVR